MINFETQRSGNYVVVKRLIMNEKQVTVSFAW